MDINEIIEELKKYFLKIYSNDQHLNFNFEDYVHNYGNVQDALLYSTLFMPELMLFENSVVLRENIDNIESQFRFQEAKKNKSLIEIESSFNFIEVGYVFSPDGRPKNELEETLLAYRIRDAWEGWLKIQFPNRTFVVEILTPEKTGSSLGIQFYQKR